MSVDYAAGLSDYDDLGVCGLEEIYEDAHIVDQKVKSLANLLTHYKGSCVVHVGAGLSTAAGIPDFRGKRGVWTKKLQDDRRRSSGLVDEKAIKKEDSIETVSTGDRGARAHDEFKPFDETEPTVGHMILAELCRLGYIKQIISQNVDGLFLKSNLARSFISELHGNFYLDECTKCRSRFIRPTASKTMRLQKSSIKCPRFVGQKACTGHLRDTILDWESAIPYQELRVAQSEAKRSKLHICIGTSMQLRPSKDLVCKPNKSKQSKLVIINLQPTQLDEVATLVINHFADDVLRRLATELEIRTPSYEVECDPTKRLDRIGTEWIKCSRRESESFRVDYMQECDMSESEFGSCKR